MKGDVIEQFVEHSAVGALETLLTTEQSQEAESAAIVVANAFNAFGGTFEKIIKNQNGEEEKLISSFYNNLLLLIQKTWIEKSDEELKEQVLYQLKEFTAHIQDKAYSASYALFLHIVDTVVYLMFGSQTKSKDFDEYALRIDPEFGIFWWYIQALPKENAWNEEKSRVAVLLGMYFLANY